MFAFLAFTCVSIIFAVALFFFRKYIKINPVIWYIFFQFIMISGVVFVADYEIESDSIFVILNILAMISYLLSSCVFFKILKVKEKYRSYWNKNFETESSQSRLLLFFIFIVSVIVTFIYFKIIGYNLFLNILLGVAVDDFASMRIAAYSGENYYAPGYVNQFKNTLLPLCISVIAIWVWRRNQKLLFWTLLFIFVPILILALLGTGQRAFLVFAIFAFLFGLTGCFKINIKYLVLPISLIFVIFSFVTSYYKNSALDESDNYLTSVVIKSIERFFYVEQEAAIFTFRHIYSWDIVYFQQFKDELLGLLPGYSGSRLQHDLFALKHGTDRGTETYSVVTGFYHNGGVFLVIIAFALLAAIHVFSYARFLSGKKSILRVMIYGALFFHLSIWVSGGLLSMVNNGVITYIILLYLTKYRIRVKKGSVN